MELIEALLLGVVQGLTEFIPISSTAHVRVVPALLGLPDPGAAFTAVIQLGTMLAVLVYFRNDLARGVLGWSKGLRGGAAADTPECRLGWAVFLGTVPIVVAALPLRSLIENEFRSLYVIAAALIGLALLLLAAELVAQRTRALDSVRPSDGWIVGLFQALALVPGVSRSGSTITGSLFLGFDRPTAARLSFLLSIPAVLLSGLFELYDQRAHLHEAGWAAVLIATAASFVVGYASIEFLLRFLRTHSTAPFALYRIAFGLLLLLLVGSGNLQPTD